MALTLRLDNLKGAAHDAEVADVSVWTNAARSSQGARPPPLTANHSNSGTKAGHDSSLTTS
jgi:hypothetical protein